jgi:hypothetical protein
VAAGLFLFGGGVIAGAALTGTEATVAGFVVLEVSAVGANTLSNVASGQPWDKNLIATMLLAPLVARAAKALPGGGPRPPAEIEPAAQPGGNAPPVEAAPGATPPEGSPPAAATEPATAGPAAEPAGTSEPAAGTAPEAPTLGEEILAEQQEFQDRAQASGGLDADMLETLSERPAFESPSGPAEIVTPESPVAAADATFQALMEHVARAQERFNAEGFTEAQTRAIEAAPTEADRNSARARFYGERIDTFVKESIGGDLRLNRLGVSEIKQPGPDFFDPTIDVWYDITTARSWDEHVAKYGSSGQGVFVPSGR